MWQLIPPSVIILKGSIPERSVPADFYLSISGLNCYGNVKGFLDITLLPGIECIDLRM